MGAYLWAWAKAGLLCDTRKRGQNMSKIITCEQVSNGHPDKICDQIADAIVTDILQQTSTPAWRLSVWLKKSQLFIAGEVTTDYRPNYNQIVHDVFNRIGAEKLGWNLTELLRIGILVDKQSPDIALGVDKAVPVTRESCMATPPTRRQSRCRFPTWSPPSSCSFSRHIRLRCSVQMPRRRSATITTPDASPHSSALCSTAQMWRSATSGHIIESMMVLAACELWSGR